MSAVSVVPPMQATQRPMAASSSVRSCISTGPLVVAIRTRNLPAVKDMAIAYKNDQDMSCRVTDVGKRIYITKVPVAVGSASRRRKPASASLFWSSTIITSPC
jgi:hypothetical protein